MRCAQAAGTADGFAARGLVEHCEVIAMRRKE